MKKRHSEEQIVAILREGEGISVKEACAKHNITEQTFYRWKRQYGGMEIDEVREARALRDENGRLKRIIADQAVQIQILQEVNSKKW